MSISKHRVPAIRSKWMRASIGLAVLVTSLERPASAQAKDDRGGWAVRELNVATGYAWLQLPPITLVGVVPSDVLNADLIATAGGEIDWRRVTSRTRYALELGGTYTGRARYSQLSEPGASASFGVQQALGSRWRLGAGVASAIVNSDQIAFQPTEAARLIANAGSLDDLAASAAPVRSQSPDLSQAVLFFPISQSLVGSDLYGNRIWASGIRAGATYRHSVRLAVDFHGSYVSDQRISSSNELGLVLPLPDSTARSAGMDVTYGRSERSQFTAALNWSQAFGSFTDEAVSATVGYEWSGRKWFNSTAVGVALRPFATVVAGPVTTTRDRTPALVGHALAGYKFRAQALIVQYHLASHDEYGNGGRNIATGFEGNVQSVVGSWRWTPPGRWTAQADFSMLRRPGNFSYINAWLSTVSVGRQLGPGVRFAGELLFDRHGSRAFEGFDLTEEGFRLNLTWTPRRHPVE